MTTRFKTLLPALAALALAACHSDPYREEPPHHYSVDRYGNRVACYPMNSAEDTAAPETDAKGIAPKDNPAGGTTATTEYECLPEYRYAYDPYYYDPFWPQFGFGLYYGWYYPFNTIIIENPRTPPPRRPPPRRPDRSSRDASKGLPPGGAARTRQPQMQPQRFPQRRGDRAS